MSGGRSSRTKPAAVVADLERPDGVVDVAADEQRALHAGGKCVVSTISPPLTLRPRPFFQINVGAAAR